MKADIVDELKAIPRGIGGAFHDTIKKGIAELEALRKERDEAVALKNAALVTVGNMVDERLQLVAERDEARRLVCKHTKKTYRTLRETAELRGWDCFKEAR